MVSRQRLFIGSSLVVLTAVLLIYLFIARRPSASAYGPAVAYSPGDLYGYTCGSGDGYAYIDAFNDTYLYEDDDLISLPLPFPFTFYGTTYTSVKATSNGTLHFGDVPYTFYLYDCFNNGTIPDVGEMVGPFWADLDLRYVGYLEYETIGEAPNRVFVLEWDDIPFYGSTDYDTVTFEVQLFEGSNKIVFLYQDVTSDYGERGMLGTVGIQSAKNGIALQYACNQPVIPDGSSLTILPPAEPNDDIEQQTLVTDFTAPQAKGKAANLAMAINEQGADVLIGMKVQWLNGRSALLSDWRWLDLNGDDQKELFILWRGPQTQPELAQFAILSPNAEGQMTVLEDRNLSSRENRYPQVDIAEVADITGDGRSDILLRDAITGQVWLSAIAPSETVRFLPLPETCPFLNGLTVQDTNNDRQLDIVCGNGNGRTVYTWNGIQFRKEE